MGESVDEEDGFRLKALQLLAGQPLMSQRELSKALGLSLGKTHYVLHALLDRGLVKARNFRRSDNKMAYAYVLTPQGMGAKLQLTRAFLTRKEEEFERLRSTIARLRADLALQQAPSAPSGSESSRTC